MADLERLQCCVAKSQMERNEHVTIGIDLRPLQTFMLIVVADGVPRPFIASMR